jgi:predicted kinase
MDLLFPTGSLVVVAGLPGAGKTTLLRRATGPGVVLDTEDLRAEGRRGRMRLYTRHYARLGRELLTGRGVVVHLRASRRPLRRALAHLARESHLVVLDVPAATAIEGQRARGRRVEKGEMAGEIRRWAAVDRDDLEREGWTSVTMLDRAEADAVAHLGVAAPPHPAPQPT